MAHNLEQFLPVLCTYSKYVSERTPRCLGKYERYKGDTVEKCMRTLLALFYRHRHSFIVIDRHRHLFFCDFFAHERIMSPGYFFSEIHTLCVTYFLSIASYCFIFDICLKRKSLLRNYFRETNGGHLDALIGREFFLRPPEISVARDL